MGKFYEALEKAHREKNAPPSPPKKVKKPVAEVIKPPEFAQPPLELLVLERPGSEIAEQFRFLRSLITRPPDGQVPRTILITSVLPQEGKTFVATNLAATIALGLDEYVLLVDADLRKPQIHRYFGLEMMDKGLSTHLNGLTPLEEVLMKTPVEKLTILPGDSQARNPAELLSSEKMKALIAEVKDRYADRLVIFDSTPLNVAPETYVIANEVDAVILVVRRGQTPRQAVQVALEKIAKEKIMGVVFNGYHRRVRKQSMYVKNYSGYGYGYGYGYGKAYKPQDK
ncbi:MAG: polysaccharide biosynthesis tyrosine autokinase [Deltaproteobacteria bacterium]|nr:polysaccharide biosynthesis tyrosine autokinase [Deltaproteobacteria bacterium]